jgi:hypothetical protein
MLNDFWNQIDFGAEVNVHAFLHAPEVIAVTLEHILHLH